MKLFDYQSECVDNLRTRFKHGYRRPLLCLPVGGGKTVIFSFITSCAVERGNRVYIIAHRKELLDQISRTLIAFNVSHGFIAAGEPYQSDRQVQVCSAQTLVRRLDQVSDPDLIIIDEAHHCTDGNTWGKILKRFSDARILGVTATPIRQSGEPLGAVFDSVVYGPSVQDLISAGRLSDYKIYAPATINTDAVKIVAGDFARGELSALCDRPTITGEAINEYFRHADGKRAVAFCVNVQHAKHVASEFSYAGYSSRSIDGKLSKQERDQIINDFRSGKIHVLTSCDLISEGFDLPAIECAISLRPTWSVGLWLQQTGRALRTFDEKDYAIILDHAGNTERHGLPCLDRDWSLDGRNRKPKSAVENIQVKICKICFAAQAPGPLSCRYCGGEFKVTKRALRVIDGDLAELNKEKLRQKKREKRREIGLARTFEDLIQLGRSRGYKNPAGWAYHILQGRSKKR